VSEHPKSNSGRAVDELADRLIEKRERLHYFVITGSAGVIAFTIANLRASPSGLGLGARVAEFAGGGVLLFAGAVALFAIFDRHRVYADYLDELAGRRSAMSESDVRSVRSRFAKRDARIMVLFYLGVVVLAALNAIATVR